jgi:hypothetical protein
LKVKLSASLKTPPFILGGVLMYLSPVERGINNNKIKTSFMKQLFYLEMSEELSLLEDFMVDCYDLTCSSAKENLPFNPSLRHTPHNILSRKQEENYHRQDNNCRC